MNMKLRNIPFSPPDMSDAEIEMVAEALRSGWITTGPKTKEFEQLIAICCGTEKAVCLNSATAFLGSIFWGFGVLTLGYGLYGINFEGFRSGAGR